MPGFVHRFVPGTRGRTLLLLHGTGGDENSLMPIAEMVDNDASILAVRGGILENGMPRFFRRLSEGVFDVEDLKFRSQELADFVASASKKYGFPLSSIVTVGYSNGANIASSIMLLRPEVVEKAVLLRPMVPFKPRDLPDLRGKDVLISAGLSDPLIPRENTSQLEQLLRSAGARVTVNWAESDHGLTRPEIEKVRSWLSSPDSR